MRLPYFVLIVAVYPVLFIATSNPGQVPKNSFAIGLSATVIGSLGSLIVMRLIFRSWQRASLAVGLLLFIFYAYGPLHTAAEFALLDWITSTTRLTRTMSAILATLHASMSITAFCLAALGLLAIRRLHPAFEEGLVRALNVAAVVLLGLVAVQWTHTSREPKSMRHASGSPRDSWHGRRTSVLGHNPDIYTIILDGYARHDVLTEQYGFDNSPFLDDLRSRGFIIAGEIAANYHWTFLSLASALNMDYVQAVMSGTLEPDDRDRGEVYDSIRNNEVMRFLKERGYKAVHLRSTWGATLENSYADVDIRCHESAFSDPFMRTLVDATWLKVLQSRVNQNLAECHLANFDTLGRLGRDPGPKFVLAHFVLPHHPYLFDREGRILERATLSNQFDFQLQLWEDRQKYIGQLTFVNRRIIEVIDSILADSAAPPVILLFSDHGPNIHRGLSADEVLRVRFASLGAFLLPGAAMDTIPQASSLVNLYRRILNHYFERGRPLLPDRFYTSPFERPYQLKEVQTNWPASSDP